jgi:cell division protein FtsB
MNKKAYLKIKQRQENKKKTKFAFIFKARFLSLIVLIFIFLAFFPLAKNFSQKRIVDQEIATIKQEIADFQSRNKELIDMLAYLESDSGQQEIARVNLGMKSPGEEVVVIKNLEFEEDLVESEIDDKSNWQKWLNYFFIYN